MSTFQAMRPEATPRAAAPTHSPPWRRSRSRSPWRREGLRDLAGLLPQQPGEDHPLRAAASCPPRPRAAAAARGWRAPSAPTAPPPRRRSARVDRDPGRAVDRRVLARSPSTDAASQSQASTGRPAEPRGGDREHAGAAAPVGERARGLELEQQLQAQPGRVVRAGAEGLARVDHEVDALALERRLPRRAHAQPPEPPGRRRPAGGRPSSARTSRRGSPTCETSTSAAPAAARTSPSSGTSPGAP